VSGAGYSGTPLPKKLGLAPGQRVALIGAPAWFEEVVPPDAEVRRALRGSLDVALCFVTARRELERRIPALRRAVAPDGVAWVCWPKRASGVATDVTEDVVREVALPIGLVDTKVAAIDETWSALKLVVRRELR
jgi:hypothetical protein